MNPVDKAIQDVMFSIPREILHYAFISKGYPIIKYPISLETSIKDKVVTTRVLPDCNMVGGVQVNIDIGRLTPKYNDTSKRVFFIPKTYTEGRTITSVLSVAYYSGFISQSANSGGMVGAAMNTLNAISDIPVASTSNVSLIGENTILIEDGAYDSGSLVVRCLLGNDTEFSNLDPTTVPAFSKLVVLAVKAWIYVNTIIPMDKGRLYGGMELGTFKEIIDGYSDANEMYAEYLKDTWKKVAFMDDKASYSRHLRLSVN